MSEDRTMPDLIDRIIEAEKRATGENAALLRDAYAAVRQRDALLAALRAVYAALDEHGIPPTIKTREAFGLRAQMERALGVQ
jgi:hypothetical protein